MEYGTIAKAHTVVLSKKCKTCIHYLKAKWLVCNEGEPFCGVIECMKCKHSHPDLYKNKYVFQKEKKKA